MERNRTNSNGSNRFGSDHCFTRGKDGRRPEWLADQRGEASVTVSARTRMIPINKKVKHPTRGARRMYMGYKRRPSADYTNLRIRSSNERRGPFNRAKNRF